MAKNSNCSIILFYKQFISLYIKFIRPSVYTEIFVAILRCQQINHQIRLKFYDNIIIL